MATNTMPSAGTAGRNSTADTVPNIVQLAQATGAPAPTQPAAIPAAPNGEVHVTIPADQTVVRVQVAPGETIDLPFDGELAARFGEQGNLAVKEGDQTIILLNYAEANQQEGVTLHGSDGHNIDVANVVAQTDPNLDIQTAAGPAAGPGGAAGGHLFLDFNPGSGLGGFGELNVINPTALQYSLISPDETILPPQDRNADTGGHSLSISSTDGSKIVTVTDSWHSNDATGNTDTGQYLQGGGTEGKAIDSSVNHTGSLANGTDDTILSLGFKGQVGNLHNMVGVYVTDAAGNVISVKFVWLDAIAKNGGIGADMYGNQQSANVDVNVGDVPPGGHVGYFLLQGGASNSHDVGVIENAIGNNHGDAQSAVDALNSHDIGITTDPATGKSTVSIDGQNLNSPVIASDDDKNSDKSQQTISGTDGTSDGLLYVGFEDRRIGPGLEGSTFKSDKDFNDVVFTVSSKTHESTPTVETINPSVHLSDSGNDINQVTIDTTGFMVGDSLANLADGSGFHVVSTQGVDGQYHVTITEDSNTTHTTAQWETFLDSIGFSSTSDADGERQMTYTVHDSAGNTGSTTANVDVATQHDAALSTETDAIHHGTALLHNGSTAGHDVTWGDANDTLHLDQHFTATDGKLDMGKGDNTLAVDATNMNVTSADTSHLTNVDHIDMTGHGTNATTLNATDILSMTGDGNTLKIDGDGTDSVKLDGAPGGQWQAVSDNVPAGYHEYQWTGGGHTVSVLIDDHITQAQIDTTKH